MRYEANNKQQTTETRRQRQWGRETGMEARVTDDGREETDRQAETQRERERGRQTDRDREVDSFIHSFTHSFFHSLVKLYFSTVKILAQRPTHISAIATVLLYCNVDIQTITVLL